MDPRGADHLKLKTAIRSNNLAEVEKLVNFVDLTADILSDLPDEEDWTFLHLAANANIEILNCLLIKLNEYGPEVFLPLLNSCDNKGNTPLLIACRADKLENILLILQQKPLTWLENHKGKSFFNYFKDDLHSIPIFRDQPTLQFKDLPSDIKAHILSEHRYHILLNLDNKQALEQHASWAKDFDIKLEERLKEELWLKRNIIKLPINISRIINRSATGIERTYEALSLARYLTNRLLPISAKYIQGSIFSASLKALLGENTFNYLHSLLISALRTVRLERLALSPSQTKYHKDKLFIYSKIGACLIYSLVVTPIFILGGFMVMGAIGAIFAGGLFIIPILLGAIGALAGLTYAAVKLTGLIKSTLHDIKELKIETAQLSKLIEATLPIAKPLLNQLKNVTADPSNKDHEDITVIIEKLKVLEQTTSEATKLEILLELSSLLQQNAKYLAIEKPSASVAITASTLTDLKGPENEHIILDIPDDSRFDNMIRDLPSVSKYPSIFYSLRTEEDTQELAPLLLRPEKQ